MKRTALMAMPVLIIAMIVSGCVTGCSSGSKAPKDWYEETLNYYKNGINTNWSGYANDRLVSEDIKDTNNNVGYVLIDLDEDGTDELMIGMNDGSGETKFLDVYIWHSDLGAYQVLSAGNGYYIYLCGNNVLRVDTWYGAETKKEFMKFKSENNAFVIVDEQGIPKTVELTSFI